MLETGYQHTPGLLRWSSDEEPWYPLHNLLWAPKVLGP